MADTYLKTDNHSINFIKFKIMEAMAVLEKQQQFDFQNNGIEVMNFETLQRTYKENDIYGKPKVWRKKIPQPPARMIFFQPTP